MNIAFKNANILLPKQNIDHTKWSVVACDQYTSEPEYWETVENLVGTEPSTYNLILPEVYLNDTDVEARLARISDVMKSYLAGDVFDEYKDAMIYIERTDSEGNVRAGIVGAIDLEEYDYNQGSKSQVRATESTVLSRIPPRVKVRKSAEIELPHIMILINDEAHSVIEPLADKLVDDKAATNKTATDKLVDDKAATNKITTNKAATNKVTTNKTATDKAATEKIEADKFSNCNCALQLIYDFDLMQGGGHLKGWLVDSDTQSKIIAALNKLGENASDNLLFAMGDGNHSLATAKKFYEDLKAANPDEDLSNHPARYALAEIVNLHSPALKFEAIHRIVEDVDVEHLMKHMREELGIEEIDTELFAKVIKDNDVSSQKSSIDQKNANIQKIANIQKDKDSQIFKAVINGAETAYKITKPSSNLTVGSLQNFLDKYLENHEGNIDYIHGEEVVRDLSKKPNAIGFILPDMKKEELYQTVISDGALPRKTFSMGHAQDKRFYMECRKIRP